MIFGAIETSAPVHGYFGPLPVVSGVKGAMSPNNSHPLNRNLKTSVMPS